MTVLRLYAQDRFMLYNKNYSICPVRPKHSNGLGKWSFLLRANMKLIQLTQGQVAKIDDWNYEYLSQWNWYATWCKDIQSFYAVRTKGKRPFRTRVYMARETMKTPKGAYCDHINHDTLDNQEHNLRNVTNSQNIMNRRVNSNNRLNEKCISLKSSGGFQVRVYANGRYVFNKTFPTLELAITARNEATKKYHGDFACLQEGA